MKKLLSIILSIAMVLCMMPLATGVAFADETSANVNVNFLGIYPSEYTGSTYLLPAAIVTSGWSVVNPKSVTWTFTGSTGTAENQITVKDAGTYKATITFDDGSYTTKSFTVGQLNLANASDLTAKISSSKTYLPAINSLSLTVKNGSSTLKAGTDYDIVKNYYKNAACTGAYTAAEASKLTQAYVKITGKGNCTGSKVFLINASGNAFSENATVDFGTGKAYTTNVTTVPSGTYINGSKLTSSARYYAVPSIIVRDGSATVGSDAYDVTWYYNGYASNSSNGRDAFAFQSSSYNYSSGAPTYFQKEGIYEVEVTAKTGRTSIRRCFAVGGQIDLANCEVILSSAQASAAETSVVKPTVTVKYNDMTLTLGVDYEVIWTDPNGKITADRVWTVKGGYVANITPAVAANYSAFKGSKTATFVYGECTKLDKTNVICTGLVDTYQITVGSGVTIADPTKGMTIYKGLAVATENRLTLGTDYRLSIVEDTTDNAKVHSGTAYSAGTYYIRVDFQGAYEGTVFFAFKVKGDPNIITVSGDVSYNKSVTSDDFTILASCTSGGECTFKSSDESVVRVTDLGTVTMAGKVGCATITITSPNSGRYESQKLNITVNAKPKKQVIKSVSSPKKGQLKVQVSKQAGAEQYQIRYSYQDSKVSSKYGKVSMNDSATTSSTQTKTINKSKYFKSGKYVYVKARAVYTKADGTKGYGAWSNVKKVKIK